MNINRGLIRYYQKLRRLKYRVFSDCRRVHGKPTVHQPVLYTGPGQIRFNGKVNLGISSSPYFLNGYIYMEVRFPDSLIELEDGVWISNNSYLISGGPGIHIGRNTLIGFNCAFLDSDFHELNPEHRLEGVPRGGKVVLGENVLVASNVTFLKGVKVGNNSVIANGTVVNRSIPPNMLAYGNPVKCGPLSPYFWSQAKNQLSAETHLPEMGKVPMPSVTGTSA